MGRIDRPSRQIERAGYRQCWRIAQVQSAFGKGKYIGKGKYGADAIPCVPARGYGALCATAGRLSGIQPCSETDPAGRQSELLAIGSNTRFSVNSKS
jgi:hypothetical protein